MVTNLRTANVYTLHVLLSKYITTFIYFFMSSLFRCFHSTELAVVAAAAAVVVRCAFIVVLY